MYSHYITKQTTLQSLTQTEIDFAAAAFGEKDETPKIGKMPYFYADYPKVLPEYEGDGEGIDKKSAMKLVILP